MLESLACNKQIVQNSALPIEILTEAKRKDVCAANDAACKTQVGTIYTLTMPTDGR